MLLAASAMTICAACTTSSPDLKVNLPAAPAICAPVPAPEIKAGQDARIALMRVYTAFLSANGHLRECRAWIEKVRAEYAGGAK